MMELRSDYIYGVDTQLRWLLPLRSPLIHMAITRRTMEWMHGWLVQYLPCAGCASTHEEHYPLRSNHTYGFDTSTPVG